MAGRSLEKAQLLAKKISAAGFGAEGMAIDVESVDAIRDGVDQLVDQFGGIDILRNCVGIQREELLLDVNEEAYDEVYRINLKSAMFLAQAVAKHQISAGKGGRQVHLLSVRSQLG
ncbi:MAG: SDR family NAD(P)-dependent oxidoreductase, partial [Gammaproteobacteria bacterium]|nr:SDR family NAD(P)-dependent oxidoreductase [Gammaproteobacteria bacterium]